MGFAFRVSQSFEASLLVWRPSAPDASAVEEPPAPAIWPMASASIDFSSLAGSAYGALPEPPAFFAASLAGASMLSAWFAPSGYMNPSWIKLWMAFVARPERLMGSVICVLDSSRSRRSTFRRSIRRRRSVNPMCRRKRLMAHSLK